VESEGGGARTIACDKVLVTVGRRPRTRAIGLDELDLTMSGAFIEVDDKCRTSMRGVFAIGDVTGEPMLAHRAMAQGEMVAEIIAGQNRAWDRTCIPAVCFTDPEIVSAGVSPDEAKARGLAVTVGTFPFRANGRSMTLERDDGFVRVVARAKDNAIIGVQAVGPGVSELSAAFAIAIEMGARADDIGAIIHAHPTLSEAFHEASLGVLGHTIHI
jgi:dihydrolipoamide dehydrogenase